MSKCADTVSNYRIEIYRRSVWIPSAPECLVGQRYAYKNYYSLTMSNGQTCFLCFPKLRIYAPYLDVQGLGYLELLERRRRSDYSSLSVSLSLKSTVAAELLPCSLEESLRLFPVQKMPHPVHVLFVPPFRMTRHEP